MDVEFLKDIIKTLSISVTELELSVIHAYDQFLVKYGVGHVHVNRLESYFPAIDKQREYIEDLDKCLLSGDAARFYEVSMKVRALSELIKNDAKSLLTYMNTGQNMEMQDEQVH